MEYYLQAKISSYLKIFVFIFFLKHIKKNALCKLDIFVPRLFSFTIRLFVVRCHFNSIVM